MTRRKRLVKEARDAIQFRGHVMRRFKHHKRGALYKCPCCKAYIQVLIKPMPNEIDIGGDALATQCVGSQLSMYRN